MDKPVKNYNSTGGDGHKPAAPCSAADHSVLMPRTFALHDFDFDLLISNKLFFSSIQIRIVYTNSEPIESPGDQSLILPLGNTNIQKVSQQTI